MTERQMIELLLKEFGDRHYHGCPADHVPEGECNCYAGALCNQARALLAAGASEGQEPVAHVNYRADVDGDVHAIAVWNGPPPPRYTKLYVDPSAEIAALCERIAGMEKDAKNTPVEFQDVERVIQNGDGQWKSCSGCYDTEDGNPTQRYRQSTFLKCPLGSGCSECGGLGAVWDDYSMYEAVYDASSVASKEEPQP